MFCGIAYALLDILYGLSSIINYPKGLDAIHGHFLRISGCLYFKSQRGLLIVSVKVQLVRKGLEMHVTVAVVSEAASFRYQ